jgi:hypothetical protein
MFSDLRTQFSDLIILSSGPCGNESSTKNHDCHGCIKIIIQFAGGFLQNNGFAEKFPIEGCRVFDICPNTRPIMPRSWGPFIGKIVRHPDFQNALCLLKRSEDGIIQPITGLP